MSDVPTIEPGLALDQTKHREVLPRLLSYVKPVPFRERADLSSKETPKKKHYLPGNYIALEDKQKTQPEKPVE